MVIRQGGVVVFPRLVAADYRVQVQKDLFKIGIPGLDELLGGGLHRGTSTMFMGPPGTGKSTLTLKCGHAAASAGEAVHFFVFDETVSTLLDRGAQMGVDLRPFIASGLVRMEEVDPAEISPGELMSRISATVTAKKTRMVIIDSVNGYLNAMPEERFLSLQLHELLSFLNHKGVITLMVLAQQGFVGSMQSPVDLTYLADSVVLLRHFEAAGSVKQAISVIKKRSGPHERTLREISFVDSTIRVGEPLRQFHGVLTGVPTLFDQKPAA
jgi:circadian clock protein KaiC